MHKYGAHIFHTSDRKVWDFVNSFVEFNRYTNSPVANYKGEIYKMPFNMNTFSRMWGISTPQEAKAIIEKQKAEITGEPKNLEEQAIALVGRDIYEKLVKGYTEKQWGRDCSELPSFIIKRLTVRFTYDNNYYNDLYQGIPIGGYNKLIEALFEGADIETGVDFLSEKEKWLSMADKVVYTGAIDEYFEYCFGKLEYRTVRFETEVLDTDNYQGVEVVNYTDRETPYTRVIEHKHFEFGTDACILRGGTLGKGVIVAKTAKPAQDNRFDMPSIGTKTMESMIAAGATGLVIEAGRTLLVEKEKTLALADAHNITIVAR